MLAKEVSPKRHTSAAAAWRRHFHIDRHVLAVLTQRGWGIVAGAVTVVLVPLWFTQVEQGYYYTFLSLLALQVFFELGFNVVVVQLVGHEAARIDIAADGGMSGDPLSIARLRSLLSLLHRWYLTAGVLFFSAVSATGAWFFRAKGDLPMTHWLPVWLALVFFASVNLYLSPRLAVLEGIGRVGQVARLRLAQSILGYPLMWAALSLGAGLRAVPMLSAVAAIITFRWLREPGQVFRPPPATVTTADHVMRWRTEIFPLQWRIAISWISGYFIFNAFVPLVFAHQGAVEAGRLGIALTVFSALSTLGMSWINAAAPRMVAHVAKRERAELNAAFVAVVKSSMAFTVVVCGLLLLSVAAAQALDLGIAMRIAPLPVLVCLALVTVTNTFIFAAATYMRAHKQEPMLAPSIAGGLLTFAAAYFGSSISTFLTVSLYAALTMVVGLPWTIALFIPYYRRSD